MFTERVASCSVLPDCTFCKILEYRLPGYRIVLKSENLRLAGPKFAQNCGFFSNEFFPQIAASSYKLPICWKVSRVPSPKVYTESCLRE